MIINERWIRDVKIERLKRGLNAYAESTEVIRLIKRGIARQGLSIHCDHTSCGCWFIPLQIKEQA